MNWYIGQEVVFRGVSNNGYVKGNIMIVSGIKQECCYVAINANSIRVPKGVVYECECGKIVGEVGELLYLSEELFAPLMDITELKEILNEETA